MSSTRLRTAPLTAQAALAAALLVLAEARCSDGPKIASGGSAGIGGLTTAVGSASGSGSSDSGSTSGSASSEALKHLQEGDSGSPLEPIKFPTFDFNGKGACTCKGKVHTTMAKVSTMLDDEALTINMYYADMILNGKSKGQKEATDKIAQNTGSTIYARPSKDEVAALKAADFDWAAYAIFAKSVTKQRQGQTYTFDKPLPVFPWPAVASRYKALADAPNKTKSWSAQVTGFHSFAVTISLTLKEASADKIVVALQTTITGDDQGKLYEDFPVARDAVYTINPETLVVSGIESTNWFFGDECDKTKEQIKMVYLVCKRTADGKVDQFPCSQ